MGHSRDEIRGHDFSSHKNFDQNKNKNNFTSVDNAIKKKILQGVCLFVQK